MNGDAPGQGETANEVDAKIQVDASGDADPSGEVDAAHRAGAVFVGATRYTGPLAWARLTPQWVTMVREMRRMPGYLYHRVYYEPPFTLGTLGFFETRDDLMRFARTGTHRQLMGWVLDEANATGGYIRVYEAVDGADAR